MKKKLKWLRVRLRRLLIAVAVLFCTHGVLYASADSGSGKLGQTPPSMVWIQVSDSRGINAWNYELAIKTDFGLEIGKTVFAIFTDFLWGGYRGVVMTAIWFLDWVISFQWLDLIVNPLVEVGTSVGAIIGKLGLSAAFIVATGIFAAIHIARGRQARAIYEVVVTGIVIALAGGALATPVQTVAGPNGWIVESKNYTMELVNAMNDETITGASQDQAAADHNGVTSAMIQTFIRVPSQIVSFGQVLDGTNCESVYDEVVKNGPYGYTEDIRKKVKECNEDAWVYADAPSGSMVAAVGTLMPSSFIILAMAVIIGGFVMLALVTATMASFGMVINIVTALLPGGARRSLGKSVSDAVIGIATFMFSMFFLMVFLLVVQRLYGSSSQPMQAFTITNVGLIVGLIAFLRYRKRIQAGTEKLTDLLTRRPGGGTASPVRNGPPTALLAAGYGAYKALRNPATRRTLTRVGGGLLGVATGNPAMAARAVVGAKNLKQKKAPLTQGPGSAALGILPALTSDASAGSSNRPQPQRRSSAPVRNRRPAAASRRHREELRQGRQEEKQNQRYRERAQRAWKKRVTSSVSGTSVPSGYRRGRKNDAPLQRRDAATLPRRGENSQVPTSRREVVTAASAKRGSRSTASVPGPRHRPHVRTHRSPSLRSYSRPSGRASKGGRR